MVEFKQTKIGPIPVDWDIYILGKVSDINRGGSPRPIESYITYRPDGINWIKIGDVGKNAKYINKTKQRIIPEGLSKSRYVKEGDFLLSNSMSFGRPYILNINGCIHDGWLVIQNYEKTFVKDFLYYMLKYKRVLNQYKLMAAGSGVLNLNKVIVSKVVLGSPHNKIEQEAIAEVLSDTDALIGALEKRIAKKRLIKQGAMQTLLTPKDDWEVFTFESLCKVFTKQTGFDYSAYIKPQLINNYEIGCIPFIQNKDFYNQYINYDTDYYIPYSVAKKFPNILLNERCLLISISGKVGNVGLFCNSKTAFIGGAVAIGKFKNIKLLDWVMNYILSEKGQYQLLKNVKEGSHKNLILDDIRKLSIPIPKKTQRDYITNLLSDMDNELNALEKKVYKTKNLKQGLIQQLLTGKIRLI